MDSEVGSSGGTSTTNHRDDGVQITSFSDGVNLHFQIMRFPKQVYVWISYNSAKLGRVQAAATTRPNNAVSVTSILRGASDNTGSGIARQLPSPCLLLV